MTSTSTMTQSVLRLQWLTLEMQSLVDRSVKEDRLREIVESYVPRRMLRGFDLWAKRDFDTLMWLRVEIDYDEHDRQIRLSGDGLPEGLAGRYALGEGPANAGSGGRIERPTCPHVGKAIDLFMRIARDRKLEVSWGANYLYRDLTQNGHRTRMCHSQLPELSLTAALAPEIVDPGEEKGGEPKLLPHPGQSGGDAPRRPTLW